LNISQETHIFAKNYELRESFNMAEKMAEKNSDIKSKRLHKQTISFNEKEFKVIVQFIDKYKIKNKSKFFRESIIATILQKLEDDYPTLF
jgi:hypothetical protein